MNTQDVGQLIVAHRPQLKAFIRKRVPNKEDAEDILQDIWYQCFLNVLKLKFSNFKDGRKYDESHRTGFSMAVQGSPKSYH